MAASQPTKKAGPLAGVRVLDLTSVVLGPYATQMLGDLGADIIKIEPPEGDTTRYTGPRVSRDMASLFMGVNRNKRSIVLDLKTPAAREALLRLVDQADVFVHNIRPQKLEPLGLGSDMLCKRNPRLIYAGIHGWREDGPYRGRPAYDDIIQGLCGVASLMDRLTGEPRYAPTILCDKTSGLVAAQAILAALYSREKTGRGQFIEIPMFETMVAFIMVEHLHGRDSIRRRASPAMRACWRRGGGLIRTADGYLCMLAYTDAQWRRFWSEVGKPRDDGGSAFRRHGGAQPQYRRGLSAGRRGAHQPLDHGLDRDVRCAGNPGRSGEYAERGHRRSASRRHRLFQAHAHPTEGELVMPDVPVQFAETPAAIHRMPPRLGEHGREILQEIGMRPDEIDALADSGGVVLPSGNERVA